MSDSGHSEAGRTCVPYLGAYIIVKSWLECDVNAFLWRVPISDGRLL